MQILHGSWIPDADEDFVQAGDFCLWVETLENRHGGPRVMPLTGRALAEVMVDDLGLGRDAAAVRRRIETRHFLLPESDGELLPSPELAHLAEREFPEPDAALALRSCAIDCVVLDDVLGALKDIHFHTRYQPTDLRPGADLLFWFRFSRVLLNVLRRDQYIPALNYRRLKSRTGRGRKKAEAFEIHPGWEIVSEAFGSAIHRFAAAMPRLCATGSATPHEAITSFDGESLLRHFCECVLNRQVQGLRLPATFIDRIRGSLLDECLRRRPTDPGLRGEAALARYRQWQRWQRLLTGSGATRDLRLGLRLQAPETESGDWVLHFVALSAADPSLQLPLADYWHDEDLRKLARNRFGKTFEKDLLIQLGHAARMVPKLWDGLEDEQPVGVSLDREQAHAFLSEQSWVLEDAGFRVMVPAWYTPEGRRRAKIRLRAVPGSQKAAAASSGYFSLDALVQYRYELAIGGETVSPEEWQQLVAAKTPLVRFRGQWLELDRAQMEQMLAFWQRHGDEAASMPLGELLQRAATDEVELDTAEDAALDQMLAVLRDPARLEPAGDPPGLDGRLRDYQKRGLAWLNFLERLGLNGCLADDMGLGKTLQVIARLLSAAPEDRPTLLIAPTSVLGNWQREVERFAPSLRVRVHHGPERIKKTGEFRAVCRDHDLTVTSYALARLDARLLSGIDWQRVVIDEAQNIKNPKAAQTRAILKLNGQHRWALTGTPVENRLLDLWSIFNFLNPGYLGKQAQFRRNFELPVQRDNDPEQAELLKRLVQPFILRRVKTDKAIIADLPDKLENRQYCNLTREQASLYEAVVKDVEQALEEAEGMDRRGLILSTLMRLKQICNHPAQFLQDNSAFSTERSHKLARLVEMLDEVIQEGESLLLFTQFTEVGGALQRLLGADYRTFYLHGGTPRRRRERMIEDFQDPDGEPAVFILSLKAGGTGITLTRANHVFHFDRWWNPAVEDQATDRAYRIGQSRSVFVHKFVTSGTLEERIDRMIEDKKALAGRIVGSDESWLTELDNDAFKSLIRLNRSAVLD